MTQKCKPQKPKAKKDVKKPFSQRAKEALTKYAPVSLLAVAAMAVVASATLDKPVPQTASFDWPVSYEETSSVPGPGTQEVTKAPEVVAEAKVETAPSEDTIVRETREWPVVAEAPKTDKVPEAVASRAEPVAPSVEVREVKPFKIPAADPPKEEAKPVPPHEPFVVSYDPTTNTLIAKPVKVEKKKKKIQKDKKPTKKKVKAPDKSANDIFMENFTRGMY